MTKREVWLGALDHLGDYGHDQFVGRRGVKEGGQHGTRARSLVRADRCVVAGHFLRACLNLGRTQPKKLSFTVAVLSTKVEKAIGG
jgi:hypothetical protein